MKNASIPLAALLISLTPILSASAAVGLCEKSGGTSLTASSDAETVTVCSFGPSSLIETGSIARETLAAKAYFDPKPIEFGNSPTARGGSSTAGRPDFEALQCFADGGKMEGPFTTRDVDAEFFRLCRFTDGSAIGTSTLRLGKNSEENRSLTEVLSSLP